MTIEKFFTDKYADAYFTGSCRTAEYFFWYKNKNGIRRRSNLRIGYARTCGNIPKSEIWEWSTGSEAAKAALRERISVTNVPYYNMKRNSDPVKSQVKKCWNFILYQEFWNKVWKRLFSGNEIRNADSAQWDGIRKKNYWRLRTCSWRRTRWLAGCANLMQTGRWNYWDSARSLRSFLETWSRARGMGMRNW